MAALARFSEGIEGLRPSRKPLLIVLVTLVASAAAVIGLYFYWMRVPVPSYEGMTAEQWLPQVAGQNQMAAFKAFEQMRPKSLPFLVGAMGRKESGWHKYYRKTYPKLPGWLRKRLTAPVDPRFDRLWNCAQIALLREPDARKALPALTRILQDKGIIYHTFAASAILRLAEEGDTAYVGELAKALRDRDPEVRQNVARAITKIGPSAKAAIPELRRALNDPSPEARLEMAWALWTVDSETNACAEALIGVLKAGRSNPVGQIAMIRLMVINPHDDAVVPVLMDSMKGEAEQYQIWDCGVLRQIGPSAKAAAPLLNGLAEKGGPRLRKAALDALKSIDPGNTGKYETK